MKPLDTITLLPTGGALHTNGAGETYEILIPIRKAKNELPGIQGANDSSDSDKGISYSGLSEKADRERTGNADE